MKVKKLVPYILMIVVVALLSSCAGSKYPPHAQHRGSENWGSVLGYTDEQLRNMTPEQFQEAYLKSKAAADANADWADSESRWYVTGQPKSKPTVVDKEKDKLIKTTAKEVNKAWQLLLRGVLQ